MTFLEEGNCSMSKCDYEMAIEHYERCLNVANENSLKTIAYFSLGNAYTLSNKRKKAINCFNDCLNLSSELEIKYFQHQIYLGLGSIHCTTKRLEDGIKKDEMDCLCDIALGGLNKLFGNYEKSLEHYWKGFSFIDCEHQEEKMQPRQRKENQQGNQQEQNKRRERPRRPRKVGGINVSKDFVNLNMKNLSIVTSAGILSGVLAVLWELAELFDKLEQYREAADIYEMYLEIVTEDENIEKQENAMKYLIQIYEEEGRDFLKDSMTTRLQEFRERKKNQELQLHEWKYNDKSTKHKELFLKLIEYGKDPNVEVKHVDDVRVIFSEEFLLGKGSDGTRVYLGLGKDGYGKAVKRILRDTYLAQHEEKIFNEINAKKSDYVLNYYCSRQDTGTEYVDLILDLCEESLERFVLSESNSLDYLQKSLPDILKQILNGLADLHSGPRPILHRDLKPSNVLRDTQGKFLIADFGISRILKNDSQTYVSDANRGTQHWIAPESYIVDKKIFDKARYKTKSDVMNAGMVAYFVATKGKHPFGTKEFILKNLLDGNPVGLKEINDASLEDLLSWMLLVKPELRPNADEALKHPYLQSDEEKFNMLCDMGNQQEMKQSQGQSSSNSDVVAQLYAPMEWMTRIDDEVLKDFKTFKKNGKKKTPTYEPTWASCLRLIRRVNEHWNDKPRTHLLRYVKVGNYIDYFLQRFPELPLLVHKIIRSTDWKTRPDLKKHFTSTKLVEQLEEINGKKSEDINDDMDLDEIERVNGRKNKENPSHDGI
ncbi:serine/threonine-protein kinase/endoribonuclease IRE1-like isoform X2 [Xenia sp. Carnegie-2017]|uniref:serine/threonine-protein kinase/endoribonuclease IRE1-like isoform X2 n=1 Tax=Xenia sp. Carnegie-2017 TaxID=2897299 RepID=UPI001F03E3DB|nr:serine/threonine-protein kinase/endoribonuclease IRE1-like isoform X2 [Xenia sp. Carnegie-2017]